MRATVLTFIYLVVAMPGQPLLAQDDRPIFERLPIRAGDGDRVLSCEREPIHEYEAELGPSPQVEITGELVPEIGTSLCEVLRLFGMPYQFSLRGGPDGVYANRLSRVCYGRMGELHGDPRPVICIEMEQRADSS